MEDVARFLTDAPVITVSDGVGTEGGTADFSITLDHAHSADLTFSYFASSKAFGGSARPNEDYLPGGGNVTLLAGETTAILSVSLVDDVFREDTETFPVSISEPAGIMVSNK
jgi:hypothetical protein